MDRKKLLIESRVFKVWCSSEHTLRVRLSAAAAGECMRSVKDFDMSSIN